MEAILRKFSYKYMEYEKYFSESEISSFFPDAIVDDRGQEIVLSNFHEEDYPALFHLTYIESFNVDGQWNKTLQGLLEEDGTSVKKQHTRYSTHGLHEYKGKFNPQIVRAIANYIGVDKNALVLDPFNGSGTTLLECAHDGIRAVGTDINPMACFVSNVKIQSLSLNVPYAYKAIEAIEKGLQEDYTLSEQENERLAYLRSWIPIDTLAKLEYIRDYSRELDQTLRQYLLLIASDLIRDYSYQEPGDLRMRRRITAFPEKSFDDAFCSNARKHLEKIAMLQEKLPAVSTENVAINCDIKTDNPFGAQLFDYAITSPPYVTALPYIDTQRISLVWLNLCQPSNISTLEASLIGSREVLRIEKQKWENAIVSNSYNLPDELYVLIQEMKSSMLPSDGFRKQAVPALMYRYFSEMKQMFTNLLSIIKPGGKYALVVGHNKTTLGNIQYLIDTPHLLGTVAKQCGWEPLEIRELQTYKRYGINSKNAINQESLIILLNPDKEKNDGIPTSTKCI